MSGTLELVQLCDSPRVYQVDGFVEDGEVARLLALAGEAARGGAVTNHDETGFSFELAVAGDALLEELRERVHTVTRVESDFSPTLRFRRYGTGEHHPPHTDTYAVADRSLVLTAMLCLDAPTSGGETHFPRAAPAPLRVAPRRGRLVLWFNHRPDGAVDDAAEHEALPVLAGEKVTLTSFVYAPPERASVDLAAGPLIRQARPRTALRLHCVDDGVPAITTGLLRSACERQGVEYVVVDARDFDWTVEPALGERDLLYRPAVSLAAMRVEQFLHQPAVVTFYRDDRGPFYDCMTPPLVLQRAGIPIPRTVYRATPDRAQLRRTVEYLGGFPVVVKWLGRSNGIGVVRVDSLPSLVSLLDHIAEGGAQPILCQYVPDATHFRLVVVGEAVAASYRGVLDTDDFRSCASDDPADYLVALDPRMAELAVRATRVFGLETAGVDILRARDGALYVLEANFPCYFAQAQVAVGVDVAGRMVQHLVEKQRARR